MNVGHRRKACTHCGDMTDNKNSICDMCEYIVNSGEPTQSDYEIGDDE